MLHTPDKDELFYGDKVSHLIQIPDHRVCDKYTFPIF